MAHGRLGPDIVMNIRYAGGSEIRSVSVHQKKRTPDGSSAIDSTRSKLNEVLKGRPPSRRHWRSYGPKGSSRQLVRRNGPMSRWCCLPPRNTSGGRDKGRGNGTSHGSKRGRLPRWRGYGRSMARTWPTPPFISMRTRRTSTR